MNGGKLGKEKEQAFRILEALSGVDEELLERSEETCDCVADLRNNDAGKAGKPDAGRRIYQFVWRHGKACAACLCLALLGAAFWGFRLGNYGGNQNTAADCTNAVAGMQTESVAEATLQEKTGSERGDREAAEEGGTPETETEEKKQFEGTMAEEAQTAAGTLREEQAEQEKEQSVNSNLSSAKPEVLEDISWEEAYGMETLGEHIPISLPKGYEPSGVLYGSMSEGENKLILTWSNGEKTFSLCLSGGYVTDGSQQETEEAIYAAENWEDKLPKPGEDGFIAFGLLLEDGILAEYQGYLSREEICALFDSIQ